MEFAQSVTLGFLLVLFLVFFLCYWNYKKKVAGFPFYNLLFRVIYWHVVGKVTKDTPLNNIAFEEFIQVGKRFNKEGLFMTYTFRPLLFIYSSLAIKFFANEKAALDKSPEYEVLEEVMGAGLTTSNGKRWKEHRKLINPAFYIGVLKEKVPLFNKHAMALVKDMEKLSGNPAFNILDILKIHYFGALNESILGLENDEGNKKKLLKIAEYADNLSAMTVKRLLYPWLRWQFLLNFFPTGRKFLQENKKCDDFINNTISDMKKRIISGENEGEKYFKKSSRKSLSYILLKHHLNNPTTFTFKDLKGELRTIMVTGYDSLCYTTMWCLFLLGLHPKIQEKAFSEIQSTISDYITYEESSNLGYLEAVIMETLRLYPTFPVFSRNLSEDVQFGTYKVFKGTTIVFFPYLSHRDPEIYPDPEKFDPERFLNSESKKTWSFIPFSEGNRSCIGQNYALIEMKIFLSHILRNFKITSLEKREDIKLCLTVVLSPIKSLRFKITPRT